MRIDGLFLLLCCMSMLLPEITAQEEKRPNVIIIITDDQGYGDLGITGNPYVQTPTIDKFAKESVRFNNFHVSPVCAPTRSSLMTGRYSLRTGVRDTYNGGAIMAASEFTIAEMLKQADYRTGIFGKWHLGDNYPSRPSDQGFDESVIHLAGGMGQVGDFTTYFQKDRSYFDPVLWHNNEQEAYEGYCSDIFASEAIRFIESNKDEPFFCYLSFNAPHTPLQVPEKYYNKYKNIDIDSYASKDGRPFVNLTERNKEDARKVYAMVDNIDDNLAKLFRKLDALKIADNTLVIFMTDNGPQQPRYVAGMKGRKGSVYQGGVRVPFYLKYPAAFKSNRDVNEMSAHIDVLPTLSEICNVAMPSGSTIDGVSLLPLLNEDKEEWGTRSYFSYWTRRYPELYNNIAIRSGDYKLVGKTDFDSGINAFEMYNIDIDPYEENSIVEDEPEIALRLKEELDKMYSELIASDNLMQQPRIIVGSRHENPIVLNRNDASGQRGIWAQEEVYGMWRVQIEEGNYDIRFKFIKPVNGKGRMYLEAGTNVLQKAINQEESDIIELKNVHFSKMQCELLPFYAVGGKNIFPFWVELTKID